MTSFARTALRRVMAAPKPTPARRSLFYYVDPKKHAKVWLSDAGAYPIIGIITCAATMASFATVRTFSKAPQLTWDKDRRAMGIEEGTHEQQAEVAKYYDHPIRRYGQRRYNYLLTHKKEE
eukprot:CAMPEP_0167790276 /NCGR_PEP_ID=MMETSP0111_2-20121227/11212_1 /TAXON_ID=91324 /ORGANISM="Lotharella globosa, Strain CCCM811" /LENGTH=120 /DNA_ID=CAMNT_0007682659 /DNA_START=102 /DNA_END=464 /DNA_ORIENTATION=-